MKTCKNSTVLFDSIILSFHHYFIILFLYYCSTFIPLFQYPARSPDSGKFPEYSSRSSLILGSIQLMIGVLCILLNVIGIILTATSPEAYDQVIFYLGYGIWTGIFVSLISVIVIVVIAALFFLIVTVIIIHY